MVLGLCVLVNVDSYVMNAGSMPKLKNEISGLRTGTKVYEMSPSSLYELLVKIDGNDETELKNMSSKIRRMNGVRSTMTHLIVESYNP
ncbi:MAG: hypothetical protein NT016_00900 [Candidatus Aenigmarchaeota archaeon]|nr:hypothetical protein [Candidatus Aenigmarchaeota archaeon]